MFYFIFLHFPLSGPVLINISLPIIPCMIMYVTNNKEPWTLRAPYSGRVDASICACALQMCACAHFSHSVQLLLQQSRAFYMLALCLRAFLISSPKTWDWTRMHALAVMHRRPLCENMDRAKIKVPFYTTDIDILCVASMYRHTSYRWIVTPLIHTNVHTLRFLKVVWLAVLVRFLKLSFS